MGKIYLNSWDAGYSTENSWIKILFAFHNLTCPSMSI